MFFRSNASPGYKEASNSSKKIENNRSQSAPLSRKEKLTELGDKKKEKPILPLAKKAPVTHKPPLEPKGNNQINMKKSYKTK